MQFVINQKGQKIEPWVERHAGLLVSIFFHLVIFSFLITRTPLPVKEEPKFKRLNLLLQPIVKVEEKLPLPVIKEPPPLFQPAAATSPQPEEKTPQEDLLPPPNKEKTQEIPEDITLVTEQLQIERKKLLAELKELEEEKKNLRAKLDASSLKVAAQPGKYSSAGAAKGAVRTLRFKGYPQEIVEEIMRRYEITIKQRFVGPGPQASFLSYAETDNGVYVNRQGRGFYEVFELSRKAMAKMSQLELQELIKRGYDIDHTAIVRAEFGIVQKNGEYDLGILELEAEHIK